ncbi:hypothetical protein SteCoe_26461 [Stentor coeruleus]|uniref:Uncharacterized protein n=1 Tax=Stentor coeruleus TaxID=5963 RepID=A0A1R2BCR2_9CILI|nr:hypothetical protein SteCoe_26461 [Stentor coeruleus]
MWNIWFKALGAGTLATTCTIVGNHYYMRRNWKNSHPLVKESLDLLLKDSRVIKELGGHFDKTSSVSGILEGQKRWASFNFNIRGYEQAAMHIVADAKDIKEADDSYIIDHYPMEYSFYDKMNHYFYGKPDETILKWKIVALNVKFDEMYSITIIGEDTGKTHKAIHDSKNAKLDDDDDDDDDKKEKIPLSVGHKRRMDVMKNVSKTYWMMFLSGLSVFLVSIYLMRYTKHHPVKNSLFLNGAVEIVRTHEGAHKILGLPIQLIQSIKGYLNYNKTKGNVDCYLYGPQGWAKMHAEGTYDPSKKFWKYEKILLSRNKDIISVVGNKD